MKQLKDNSCDSTVSTNDERSIGKDTFSKHHKFHKNACLIHHAVSSFESKLEVNTKVLELRLKDITQTILKMQEIIDMRLESLEQRVKDMDHHLLCKESNEKLMILPLILCDLDDRIETHDIKFNEMEQKSSKIEDRLKKLEDSHETCIKSKICNLDQGHNSMKQIAFSSLTSLESTSKVEESNKEIMFPFRPVPGFETIKLTWYYQSQAGNYLTAHTFSEVGTVNHKSAFQEWTAVPAGDSFIYLRNVHGSYLRAHPDGKVESWHKPTEWERWKVKKYDDGRISLISFHKLILLDRIHVGIYAGKSYGFHKWRLTN
jgi:hypothetical protein